MAQSVLTLLLAVVTLAWLAHLLRLPRPFVYLGGGVALGLVPGLPPIPFDSAAVFLLFFPILLYAAAEGTPWNDFRPNAASSISLGLVLVVLTTLAVGLVVHALTGLPWALAFLMGVIVADPDIGLFSTFAANQEVPQPIRVVLSGEGLAEGTAMLLLYLALSDAVTQGDFSLLTLGLDFVIGPVIGGVVGLAVAWVLGFIFPRSTDTTVSLALWLAMPFAAYLPAQALGGVRLAAVVTAGLYTGWKTEPKLKAGTRLRGRAVWAVLVFLINGAVYVPAGAALPRVLGSLEVAWPTFLAWSLVVALVVIIVRAAYVLGGNLVVKVFRRKGLAPWPHLVLGALASTRGAFALASSLALPQSLVDGSPFPSRDLMIALSLGVVIASLALQAPLIWWLLRALTLGHDERRREQEALAWERTAEAALAELGRLEECEEVTGTVAEDIRRQYRNRAARYDGEDSRREAPDMLARRALLAAERRELAKLKRDDAISDAVFGQVQHELDLIEAYLGGG